jgi:trimethylamine--corrinoid protein Co-methyltransferase
MVLKVVNGIQISADTLAMDVIREVGPAGEFITHEHTYNNFKKLSNPKLMDRDNRENWEAAGSQDIAEVAFDKSLDILKNFQPKPRPDNVQKALDSIYAEYEQMVAEHKAKAAA